MNQKTEKDIILYYLNNLLKHATFGDIEDNVCSWFETNSYRLIGKDIESDWEKRKYFQNKDKRLLKCCKTIRTLLNGKTGRFVHTSEVNAVMEAFHFSPEYLDVVALHVHLAHIPLLYDLADYRDKMRRKILAGMLDISMQNYEKTLAPTSELLEKGLWVNGRNGDVFYADMFKEIMYSQCRTPEAVKRVVLGKPQKATLKPEHFEHLKDEYGWIKNLLSNALAKQQRGVNVLIYGKPGTGKTEIVKTLCKEIGTSLFAVSGNISSERKSVERRSELAAALCLLENDQNSVLLMDEAEDVFGDQFGALAALFGIYKSDSKSKLFFNKLLESNAVPVIWVSNSIHGVDPAHLRRFSYAMNMEAPDEAVQTRIWNYSARKNKVKLPKEKIGKLVKSYDIAPAIIDTSLRTAALTGDHDAIEKTIDALQSAMGNTAKREFISEHEFSTALLNSDTNLENLTKRVKTLNGVNFSLCLYGVPGSGKSAYARFLAEQLKMKVLHKRASDLMSMWLGESEKNIAGAFAEAKRKKMLLVIDEADSFLQDRRNAICSWEVSTVNEMLTQMESHPLPFVCTTNLMDDLDQASLRRFTFKVKYDFLTRQQTESAFKHFFGSDCAASLGGLTCLSPGDFAVVAKKANICGIDDHSELVRMLRQEQNVKDVQSNPIGFTVS